MTNEVTGSMWSAAVLTLYPEMFPGTLGQSLAGRALADGLWSLDAIQIRGFATDRHRRSEEHTSELQSLMRISYAVFCLQKKRQETYFVTHYTKTVTE